MDEVMALAVLVAAALFAFLALTAVAFEVVHGKTSPVAAVVLVVLFLSPLGVALALVAAAAVGGWAGSAFVISSVAFFLALDHLVWAVTSALRNERIEAMCALSGPSLLPLTIRDEVGLFIWNNLIPTVWLRRKLNETWVDRWLTG